MGNRSHYTEEFKKDAVRLALSRGNRTLAEIAEGLGVSQSMLHRWQQKYGGAAQAEAVNGQEQREDVEKLRRRLRELEQENALLKNDLSRPASCSTRNSGASIVLGPWKSDRQLFGAAGAR